MRVSEVFWWSWLWFRNRTRQKIQSAAAFTKNGHDHSSRVRWMVDALACLKGVRSLVIDGELVASDGDERKRTINPICCDAF
jgi:ATP-dependent DNA ligase